MVRCNEHCEGFIFLSLHNRHSAGVLFHLGLGPQLCVTSEVQFMKAVCFHLVLNSLFFEKYFFLLRLQWGVDNGNAIE